MKTVMTLVAAAILLGGVSQANARTVRHHHTVWHKGHVHHVVHHRHVPHS